MKKRYYSSDNDRSEEEEEVICSLKIKHKNRVKKIPSLPTKFSKLNAIVKKKYEEFKEGKSTYSMSYLDEENELINISDEEDYLVFKEFVEDKSLTIAKVFLCAKGEEKNFDPAIDDNKTICESMIMDDYDRSDRNFLFSQTPRLSMPMPMVPAPAASPFPYEILDSLKKQIDYLVEKDKKEEIKKAKQIESKEVKEAEKKAKQEAKKKQKEKAKKEKQEKQAKKKAEKAKDKNRDIKSEINQGAELVDVAPKIEVSPKSTKVVVKEVPKQEEKVEIKEPAKVSEDAKHEFAIQPSLKRKDDKKIEPKVEPKVEPPVNQEIVDKEEEEKSSLCEECKTKLNGKIQYRCSICGEYCICETCEVNSKHQHIFIKIPIGTKFDKEVYDEFCQKLLGIYADNIDNEDRIPEAIVNEKKNMSELKTRAMNVKKASNLNKDKYKDGLIIKKGELVELEWDVKNFTNSDWPDNVTVECLPTSDIIIDEQLANVIIKSGQKGKLNIKFYAPRDTQGKDKLEVDFGLFEDTKTSIGDIFKVKLIISS